MRDLDLDFVEHKLPVKVYALYLRQDDPKKNTVVRLAKFGYVILLRNPRQVPRGVLILDPFVDTPVSPQDREIVEKTGILVIDCSWAKSVETFRKIVPQLRGVRRRLPFLVSANPSHYGKPYMLTSAEAIAATLYITGFKDLAETVLSVFKWGPEFLRINYERLEAYASGNLEVEREYYEHSQENVEKLLKEFHDVPD